MYLDILDVKKNQWKKTKIRTNKALRKIKDDNELKTRQNERESQQNLNIGIKQKKNQLRNLEFKCWYCLESS